MSKKRKNNRPSEFSLSVKVNGNQDKDITYALSKFKKMMKKSRKLLEYQERMEYIKPSDKKRRIKQQAIQRKNKELAKE